MTHSLMSRPSLGDLPHEGLRGRADALRRGPVGAGLVAALLLGGLPTPSIEAAPRTQTPAPVQAEPSVSPSGQTPPSAAPPVPARPMPAEVTNGAKTSIARAFAAYSGKVLRKDELAVADLELSLLLAQQAVELSPDDVFAWRALFNTTLLCDGTDERIEGLRSRAIERILALDPADEQMKLRRLVEAIDRSPTVEERAARFETLLDPKNRAAIGDRIASRLAFKYAFLLQRTGDIDGFERWLGESVTLDPANPESTAMAAGYFRFAADDASKEAELLMTAMLANPLDTLAMRGFASLLLQRGAYVGAARFLDICADLAFTELPLAAYDELLGDVAIARWAAGRPDDAVELLVRRQRHLNEYFRGYSTREDPTLLSDPKRLAELRFPAPTAEAVARAAVVRSQGKADEMALAMTNAFESFDAEITRFKDSKEAIKADDPDAAERGATLTTQIATSQLNAALFAYWIAEDQAKGDTYIADAEKTTPLSDAAKSRFAAWSTLRSKEPAKALEQFQALKDETPAARIGMALAYLANDDRKTAAATLLGVWRERPDTLFGVDARSRLAAIIGRVLPVEGVAADLERLADSIPSSFDRMFREGARPIAVQLHWGTAPQNVYSPIRATLDISNLTPWPLAIDDTGPIRNILCFQATIAIAGRSKVIEIPYLFHPLDHEFVVPARGTYSLPVDFAYTELGVLTLPAVQPGCTLSVRAVLNWDTTKGGLLAGRFGDSSDADLLRIEGTRLTDESIPSIIARGASPTSFQDLIDYVAVVHAAATATLNPELVSEGRRKVLDQVWPSLSGVLAAADVPTKCWLLFVLPDNVPPMESALDTVRPSSEPLVRLAYLVRRASSSSDPIIEAAIQSGDERIASYGRTVKEMLLHDEEVTRRDFNLGTGKTSEGDKPNLTPEGGQPGATGPGSGAGSGSAPGASPSKPVAPPSSAPSPSPPPTVPSPTAPAPNVPPKP